MIIEPPVPLSGTLRTKSYECEIFTWISAVQSVGAGTELVGMTIMHGLMFIRPWAQKAVFVALYLLAHFLHREFQ